MRESLLVTSVYKSCVVTMNGKDSRVDLIVLDLVGFDVILEMDWLVSCNATIDSHHKTVKFAMLSETPFEF